VAAGLAVATGSDSRRRISIPTSAATFFDNRGIGETACESPLPWPIEDFAGDLAELVEGVCGGPVCLIGSSLGSAIVQQVAIDFPYLVRDAIVMGSGAPAGAGITRRLK
jgi:pimeloyl-ACP methyl ester carboxylesterase